MKINNLPGTQAFLLHKLNSRGATSMGEIAEILGCSTPAATQTVDQLERRGFVVRNHDRAVDRRKIYVSLTDEGKKAASEATALIN